MINNARVNQRAIRWDLQYYIRSMKFRGLVMPVEQVIQTAAVIGDTKGNGFVYYDVIIRRFGCGNNYFSFMTDHIKPLNHPGKQAFPQYRQHYLAR